ncbi:thiamine phosphate synthase [Candidatus Gracilibacteria bacterium]|nr:thiamine phosphate synthase [Candidatus Gracilibacteria bacterium]
MHPAIIDANIHRVCEGLRVIEEYFRFVMNDEVLTNKLASLRKKISHHALPVSDRARMEARDMEKDARTNEVISSRKNSYDLLLANMKRSQEALRVLEEYTGDDNFRIFRYELYELEKDCFLNIRKPVELRGVYLISHDVDILRRGLELGADIIQLRCKDTSKHEILEKAHQAKKLAEEFQKPLIINDHLDIAQIIDADGIHTGQDDISIADMRKTWSPDKIYGRTTHSFEQGVVARDQGASYVSVGPIWATPTKPDREAIGFKYLSRATELGIPFVAIGGVNNENISEILAHSPSMIAIVRDYESIPEFQQYFAQFR